MSAKNIRPVRSDPGVILHSAVLVYFAVFLKNTEWPYVLMLAFIDVALQFESNSSVLITAYCIELLTCLIYQHYFELCSVFVFIMAIFAALKKRIHNDAP